MSNIWYLEKLVVTNPCGEIYMPPYDCCCLGALVLPRFVVGGEVDWDLLKEAVQVGIRFLDDVLTVNTYPLAEIQAKCSQLRRIGLGVTGLHHMLLELGLKYNAPSGLEFVDDLMKKIKNWSYETSSELAKEKGSFPAFDADKFLRSGFCKTLKPSLREKIRRDGMRNCAVNTIAPTGTISMVCETSSGIEPIFAAAYERRFRKGDEIAMEVVVDPMFQRFVNEGRGVKHFVGAHDLSIRDHLEMQRVCQRHIDNAVSKCLAAGTLVATDKGLLPIESFSDVEGDDQFVTLDGSVRTSGGDRITQHYRLGVAPATRIRLSNGAELMGATATHRVMTTKGWTLMKDLIPGDRVLLKHEIAHGPGGASIAYQDQFKSNSHRILTPKQMSPELAEFLGMLASDGHTQISTGCVSICWKSAPEVPSRFSELSQILFDITPRYSVDPRNGVESLTITSRNLVRYIESLIGRRARDKHVPAQILAGSDTEKLAFLRGLTLDGYVTSRGLCVYFGMSKELAYHAAEMCRSFGLPYVTQPTKTLTNGEPVYGVAVSGPAQSLINPIETRKRGTSVVSWLVAFDRALLEQPVTTSHPHYSAVRALRQDRGRDYCTNEVAQAMGWDCRPVALVTHVEDAGMVEMYDIEVEGSHSYIVNGMVSHNTINLPPGTTEEELGELYTEFIGDLKGVTVYPDGSRENQPLTPLPLERAIELAKTAKAQATSQDACRSGVCDV